MALEKKLLSSFWSDDDVGRLDPHQKLAMVWVLTNKDMTNIGYLKVQERQFRFDTGLGDISPLQGALKGLGRGFLFEDREGGLGVLSLNFIRYQFGESIFLTNSRLVRNLVGLARGLPEVMQTALCQRYKGLTSLLQEGRGIEGASMGLVSPQYSTEQYSTSEGKVQEGEKLRLESKVKKAAEKNGPENVAENLAGEMCTNVPRGTTKLRLESMAGGNGQLRYDLGEEVLKFLNEKTGALYLATPAVLREIALRLAEVGNDCAGVKRMIERQCAAWSGDAKMAGYLRPQTLFAEDKFGAYWGQRELPLVAGNAEERKKWLRGKIETSPANRQSAYHSGTATAEQREELKRWRRELEELEK